MSAGVSRAFFDPLRSLSFAGISALYAAVGSAFTHPVRAFGISNNTDGDLILSFDNTLVAGNIFVGKGSYKVWDIQSNMNSQFDDKFTLPIGAQFYVKQVTAPTTGNLYIECIY